MQIDLPPRLEAVVREKVASGDYPDAAAVLVEAVQLLEQRDDQQKLSRLRAALQIGLDQLERGEGVEWTPALFERIMENAQRKFREGKLPNSDVLP